MTSAGLSAAGERDRLLDRAWIAGSALVAAAVVVTGVFIGKIAHAATGTTGTGAAR